MVSDDTTPITLVCCLITAFSRIKLSNRLPFFFFFLLSLHHTGSGDIVNGDLKLTLGLIWTLILHYQISIGFGLDDKTKGAGTSAKQVLIEYVKVSICYVVFSVIRF